MSRTRTAIGDIEGGKAPAELKPDDNITIEHLYQTYRWYPGFAEMHDLQAKAIWANGLTDDTIPDDRILEMKNAQVWCYLCGYVAVVVNTMTTPPSIEAWNPEIEGTGFIFKKFSDFGYPLEIEIQMKFAETGEPYRYMVPNFPVESMELEVGFNEAGDKIYKEYHLRQRPKKSGYGFFIIRNSRGLPGVRGLPEFLPLMHPVRYQLDILNAYVPFAKKQGMGFPYMGLKDNTPQQRTNVRDQWESQPQTNRLILGDAENVIDYIQPTEGSYNPEPILVWIDQLMARKTQMNKLMLEGDPSGYLSASETAENNWVRDIKEQMVFWKAQWEPIWKVSGATEDCTFMDPSRPAFVSLMEGIEKMVNALIQICTPQSIVELANMYLEKHGEQLQLEAREDDIFLMQSQGGNNDESESNQARQNSDKD
jgi:hypothetical protein